MAQNRNGMMSSAPSLVQALRPGFINTAMDPGLAEYQTPALGNVKMPYDPQAAAEFQAAIQKNMAQRPQMGQQVGQMTGLGGVQNAMRVFSPEEQQMMSQRLQNLMAQNPGQRAPSQPMRNAAMQTPPFFNPPPQMPPMPGGSFFQNMAAPSMQQQPQQPQMQAPAQSANAPFGRERQSPGVYKDPKTGALYGQNGKLLRPGSKRMR